MRKPAALNRIAERNEKSEKGDSVFCLFRFFRPMLVRRLKAPVIKRDTPLPGIDAEELRQEMDRKTHGP